MHSSKICEQARLRDTFRYNSVTSAATDYMRTAKVQSLYLLHDGGGIILAFP